MNHTAVLTWSDNYQTGNARVDSQHKQLFQLLEEMDAALDGGNAIARRALHQLLEYSRYHFEDEERYMQRLGYPELDQHRREHGFFIIEVEGLLDELEQGVPVLTVELINITRRWLIDHILHSDMKIRDFNASLAGDGC